MNTQEGSQLTINELVQVEANIQRLLNKAKHWSRQVSCGFLSSEIHRVGLHDVMIDCYRFYTLADLNRRELEQCEEWCEIERKKLTKTIAGDP